MSYRLAQVGIDFTCRDLFSAYKGVFGQKQEEFSRVISGYLSSQYGYLINSGTSACHIILKSLGNSAPAKKEVILPAYTASTVVLAVLKAGLRPVLCDISLNDFNIDLKLLPELVTKDTLCVLPVHMFGIPVRGIETLKSQMPDTYVVEDCAQSLGSKINASHTGSFSDIAFASFNRGKNLPTYGGGCIFTNSPSLAQAIENEITVLKEPSIFFKFILPLKIVFFSLGTKPAFYSLLYPFMQCFKYNRVSNKIPLARYTGIQASFGFSLFKGFEESVQKRYQNGIVLIQGLSGVEGVTLPSIPDGVKPAFSRLPVLFKDSRLRGKAEIALKRLGIDTSRMYLRPLHHIFELGYAREEFPHANYLAERLITLPTHPLVSKEMLIKIIDVVKKAVK